MRIGIIGAMEVEVADLVEALEGAREMEHAGATFHVGSLYNREVVVTRCGIAKVSAAITTQVLIDTFGCTHVINTGVAGSCSDGLQIGDIVVGTKAVHHDMDVTPLGYVPGEVPGLPVWFEADAGLVQTLSGAITEAVAGEAAVVAGPVASGERFVADGADRERIAREFGALCCEMEGAAIAQTCYLNKVPYVVVRAISDNADGSSSVAYPEFEAAAASRMARAVGLAVASL